MFLTWKPEIHQKEADQISERAAKQIAYAKAAKISGDQIRYSKEQAREFSLAPMDSRTCRNEERPALRPSPEFSSSSLLRFACAGGVIRGARPEPDRQQSAPICLSATRPSRTLSARSI